MSDLMSTIARYGIPVVFLNVLFEQLGVPVPAVPALVVAGALAWEGRIAPVPLALAALLATLMADTFWFRMGRRHGTLILKLVCRLSLSPDSCVKQTETFFERWGLRSLLVGKFIPGFSMVASPLTGALRVSYLSFLIYDTAGAILWAGSALVAGAVFHETVDALLARGSALGGRALLVVATAFGLVIAFKWFQRQRFYRVLRMARITVAELKAQLDEGQHPCIVDLRSRTLRERDSRRIPGAILLDSHDVDAGIGALPPSSEIVLYCT